MAYDGGVNGPNLPREHSPSQCCARETKERQRRFVEDLDTGQAGSQNPPGDSRFTNPEETRGKSKLLQNVMKAARDFHARKLWHRFTNYDCFVVRLPDQDDPVLATVMGAAGEQYGLMLFRGPDAIGSFEALIDPSCSGDDTVESMDMLSFSMSPFGEIDPKVQTF